MTRVAALVNILRAQGIEVGTLNGRVDDRHRHVSRPARTSSSSTSRTAASRRTCSRSRTIPDPALTTYDDSGWSMGYAFNVDVKEIKDKAILDAPTTPVKTAERARARVDRHAAPPGSPSRTSARTT